MLALVGDDVVETHRESGLRHLDGGGVHDRFAPHGDDLVGELLRVRQFVRTLARREGYPARNVSQAVELPARYPRVNHSARCVAEPCVKESTFSEPVVRR